MTVRRKTLLAIILWLVLAATIWTVIFDRLLVLAGRRYSYDATMAARSGRYLLIDAAMRPAIAHAIRVASLAAVLVAGLGIAAVVVAARQDRHRREKP